MRFQTYSHSEFKFYYDLFYPAHGALQYKGRKKRVHIHGVALWAERSEAHRELLTPRVLAYWFTDDGSYTSKKNRTYRFNTQSFPLEDQ